MKSKVVTRMAPSPTGNLHIGTVRATLFAWLFARHNDGKFILRIEDTDIERSEKKYEENILSGLEWLGINHDEFYRQSERGDIYAKYINELLANDKAYKSKENEGKNKEVIRFRNPNKLITFIDIVHGKIEVDTTELGDLIIAINERTPLYHLANVIDDIEMGVTHIIRGEDHIYNTPRQILFWEAFGKDLPEYAHYPFVLGKDRKKLSKRDNATSLDDYKEQGYLKEGIINYLALLGWNPKDDTEIFTLQELIRKFDLTGVQKSGAIFDIEKLNWINKSHLDQIDDSDYIKGIRPFLSTNISDDLIRKSLVILRERISYYGEARIMESGGELDYLHTAPSPNEELIVGKSKASIEDIRSYIGKVIEILDDTQEFTKNSVKEALWEYSGEIGRGKVLWPMRVLLTGLEKSPDPFTVAEILGKEETINRLRNV